MVIGCCRALDLLMAGWEWSEVVEVQEEQGNKSWLVMVDVANAGLDR